MLTITTKSELKPLIDSCVAEYESNGIEACVSKLHELILSKKVKFPLLEFCGKVLHEAIRKDDQILFCDKVENLKTEGGNVILGMVLQLRLANEFHQSLSKATEYISKADIWYVCDIIGERVYGFSLLKEPQKTIPEIKKLTRHKSNWVIRSLGAGMHYAIKKGLSKTYVETTFPLLLGMANTNDKETRQGVGWAAKTTAKFHPDVINKFASQISDTDKVANWFRRKVDIGLNRNQYAKGN